MPTQKQQVLNEKCQSHGLIKAVLVVILAASLFAGLTNFFAFHSYTLGTLNAISGLASGLLLYYYSRRGNLSVTSWLVCGVVIFNMLALIGITKGSSYTLIWLTIVPPICFFLLGKRNASWLVGITFSFVAGYVWLMRAERVNSELTIGSFLNIFCSFIVLWLLFRHYEASRAKAYSELERLSITDKLTGIYNRSKLDLLLTAQLTVSNRLQQSMVVILADCDHFKVINDKFGHLYGDYVLKQLAATLREHVRDTDVVGRWGGEEFLIVCPHTTTAQAYELAERLREKITSLPLRHQHRVTMTFGIAESRENDDMTHIISRADKALYRGKAAGRDQVIIYS